MNEMENLHSRYKEIENELNRLQTTLSRELGNCYHQQEKKLIAKAESLFPKEQINLKLQLLRTLKTVNKPVPIDQYLNGVKNFILRSNLQLTIQELTKMILSMGIVENGMIDYNNNPNLIDNMIGFME